MSCKDIAQRLNKKQKVNSVFCLQPFQWRQWNRTLTWLCSLPITAAILVSWRACGHVRALIWTESSSSLQRRSLSKATDSKTSPDKKNLTDVFWFYVFIISSWYILSFISSIFILFLFFIPYSALSALHPPFPLYQTSSAVFLSSDDFFYPCPP